MRHDPGDCPTCPDNLLLIADRSDVVAGVLGLLQARSWP